MPRLSCLRRALGPSLLLAVALSGAGARAADLSAEAKRELARASAAVENARAHDALWTTAAIALKNAKKAASAGDSAAVTKYATTAQELAKLGLAQTHYPPQR